LNASKPAEGAVDGRGQLAARCAAASGLHDRPENRVVAVPAAVVADRAANRVGQVAQPAQQVFDALACQVGVAFQCGVGFGDVGLVVLVVVNPHGLFVDIRFERVVIVGQRGKFKWHGHSPVQDPFGGNFVKEPDRRGGRPPTSTSATIPGTV
jgi:hypothetical protein